MCGNYSNWRAETSSSLDPGPAIIPQTEGSGSDLSRERIGDVFAGIRTQTTRLKAGDTLVSRETPVSSLFMLTDGLLCGSVDRAEGGQRILGFFYPGNLVLPGSALDEWRQDIRAMTDATVKVFAMETLDAACAKDPRLGLRLFFLSCSELSRRIESERRFRALSVEGRFARFLLEVGARMGKQRNGRVVVPLPIMRTEIANYLGFRTETACRILARWKKQGLISTKDRRVIEIKDLPMLREIAKKLGAPNIS